MRYWKKCVKFNVFFCKLNFDTFWLISRNLIHIFKTNFSAEIVSARQTFGLLLNGKTFLTKKLVAAIFSEFVVGLKHSKISDFISFNFKLVVTKFWVGKKFWSDLTKSDLIWFDLIYSIWHNSTQPFFIILFSCCSRYVAFVELINLEDLLVDDIPCRDQLHFF